MSHYQDLIPSAVNYEPRFRVGGYDRYGKVCAAEIAVISNAVQTPVDLYGAGDDPITIQTSYVDGNIFRPIVGSQCELNIQCESYRQVAQLGRGGEKSYRVRVYEDTEGENELIYWGFINPETYQESYARRKPQVQVTAVDGFALLDNVEFEPTYGLHQISHVLAYLFYQAGHQGDFYDMTPWEWSIAAATRIPLLEGEITVLQYKGKSCREVLSDIMDMWCDDVNPFGSFQINARLRSSIFPIF